jgi:hypothetical protein
MEYMSGLGKDLGQAFHKPLKVISTQIIDLKTVSQTDISNAYLTEIGKPSSVKSIGVKPISVKPMSVNPY